MGAGRPTDYTPELAALICHRIANGELLLRICKNDDMPHQSTVYRWLLKYKEFSDAMREAREAQAWMWAEECLDIADENDNDLAIDDDGKTIVNWEHINRSKLRIDTRKWAVGKIAERIFGDKVEVEAGKNMQAALLKVIRPDDKSSSGDS